MMNQKWWRAQNCSFLKNIKNEYKDDFIQSPNEGSMGQRSGTGDSVFKLLKRICVLCPADISGQLRQLDTDIFPNFNFYKLF